MLTTSKPRPPSQLRLNAAALQLCRTTVDEQQFLRIHANQLSCGSTIVDFGIESRGGIAAGLRLANICMAGQAIASIIPGPADLPYPIIQVQSDHTVAACMASQYAGWAVKHDKYFAMGSGPMRLKRGRELVLEHLSFSDPDSIAVGVLETDQFPEDAVCLSIAAEAKVDPSQLFLCVAPTRSIAGCVQVVARSVETCLHKLFELGFDLSVIVSSHGMAPLPPPAKDFAAGIGRTNDAILYGGYVTLWVDTEDDLIESIGAKVPSNSSKDWSRPFADVFKEYDYDFYKVDPGLFSPAVVTFCNLRSGRSWRFGQLRPDVIRQSFATIDG